MYPEAGLMRPQGRVQLIMQHTVPLISYEANDQKQEGDMMIEINAPGERWSPPQQIRMLVVGARLVNLPLKPTEPAYLRREVTMRWTALGSGVQSSSCTHRLVSKSLWPEAIWS